MVAVLTRKYSREGSSSSCKFDPGMETHIKILRGSAEDIPAMIELDRASDTCAHWTQQQYEDMFRAGHAATPRFVVAAKAAIAEPTGESVQAQATGQLYGFIVARNIAPEWEIENIVVLQKARRKGLGRRLLEVLIDSVRRTNSEAVFLEVRESNRGARALYERAGFQIAGRRKSYYMQPLEDAILYRLQLR
jgi:ribosomal-protein-alanine acetyltransferase